MVLSTLLARSPAQRTYELIPPVVLFGRSPAERARQTGAAERTIYRQVERFEARGLAGLEPPKPGAPRILPPEIRAAILALKAEHPPFRPHELAGIIAVRFDRAVSHHTVARVLAEGPLPQEWTRFSEA